MSELKAFDVGLGQYCENGSPCVVAFDADRNPRLLNEKVYLKYDVDAAIDELKTENESLLQQNRELCLALQVMYSKEEYDKQKAKADKLHSCLKYLVMGDLIKDCPPKKVATEIVKEYDNGLG